MKSPKSKVETKPEVAPTYWDVGDGIRVEISPEDADGETPVVLFLLIILVSIGGFIMKTHTSAESTNPAASK